MKLRFFRQVDAVVASLARIRVLILIVFHLFVFAASYLLATLLRFDFTLGSNAYVHLFESSLPIVICVQLLVGVFFGFYRGWWRYVGMSDVIKLVAGQTVSLALLLTIWYVGPPSLSEGVTGISRGVLLINWAFTLLTLFGARVLVRATKDRTRDPGVSKSEIKRVLIIGAGDAGETLAREIEHRPQLGMRVVGFVDDHMAKWNSQIRGVNVNGPISRVGEIAEETSANEALIAIPSASGARMREIINQMAGTNLRFKTIPGIDQIVSGKLNVNQLRPVIVEDLLRREKIELPGDPVRKLFRGKRVLLTGAGGTIGSELATQILELEPESLELVERSEYALYQCRRRLEKERGWLTSVVNNHLLDIRDEKSLRKMIGEVRPQIVLHAAAHKHVPLGEENPAEYVQNNTLATRRLAEICSELEVERFVFISTDKAINPTSVMGASKRAGEIALLDLSQRTPMKLASVRFGNVIGSSGSVVPLFLEQIADGGPVTVTHPDVTRYFLRTSEAVSLVLQAATLGNGGNIFMLDMGEPVKIVDLARDLIHLSSHTEREIPIAFTGLRQGEKLYEEIRLEGESIHATVHPQIVVTEAPQPDLETVTSWLKNLEAAVDKGHAHAVFAMKEVIPEYTISDKWLEFASYVTPSGAKAPARTEKEKKSDRFRILPPSKDHPLAN